MGLGIYIKGEINKSFLSFQKKSVDLSTIKDYLTAQASGVFKVFRSFSGDENTLQATLHPCEEPVYFELSKKTIVCSAKTNSVGPGYHAYLVQLIEQLGRDLGITWYWDLEEGDDYFQDETGYFHHRNYEQLQYEMLRWLKALCQHYVDETDGSQIMISLPMGFPRMQRDYFAVSPIRIWDKDWFDKVGSQEPEDLSWAGKEFFIWWKKEADAEFYKRTGIAMLNVDCPWHYPVDDDDKRILTTIDQLFEEAKALDSAVGLPGEDWTAVKNLLAEDEVDIPATEYGYRKHLMTFDLPGDWLMVLPGTMCRATDGNTLVFYDHIRTVRCVAYNISKEESDAAYAEKFFDDNENVNAGTEILDTTTGLAGKAIIYYTIDKDEDSEYWVLQGVKVKDNEFLLSTICYPTEEHKAWAIETWTSIKK